jgi:hypothetical protein
MHPLVLLAKKAVETFITEGKIISPSKDLPKELLKKQSGTFVTIEKEGKLRGCIGTFLPTQENIAKEVIRNAIAAATEDYRFGPVQPEELSYLSYTVYTLSQPELVKDIKTLNPKKYGIIVTTFPISPSRDVVFNGHVIPKRGLLLPDLESIDTVEKQISIACQKAGINPREEKILIYKFTVEKFK